MRCFVFKPTVFGETNLLSVTFLVAILCFYSCFAVLRYSDPPPSINLFVLCTLKHNDVSGCTQGTEMFAVERMQTRCSDS